MYLIMHPVVFTVLVLRKNSIVTGKRKRAGKPVEMRDRPAPTGDEYNIVQCSPIFGIKESRRVQRGKVKKLSHP